MKVLNLFIASTFFSVSLFAANNSSLTKIECASMDTDGASIKFTINPTEKTILLEKMQITAGNPPYPMVPQTTWALNSSSISEKQISVEGMTTGYTTGKHGRIRIKGQSTNVQMDLGVPTIFYAATATITPPTTIVIPAPAKTLHLTCQLKVELKAGSIGQKCEATILSFLEKKHNALSQPYCSFQRAAVAETKFEGAVFSVVEVGVEACGGSGIEELIVKNENCDVIQSEIVHSD
jgi:hypothetical protein